ncbi:MULTISPECIES: DNA repair protein RadC [unclassified Gemella]|uniref:RadC family protein n=1 Tax=unclassified Gemella TaxID=2624949 RepID=UPI0015D00348|nr:MULTISPECIES: DNA repair protein RadC [unclassified Gemella]MBF0710479.1 DNA repair protein RadC [Gemella sp. GL1.1]NYS27823.1 DNA repair protein RadC [Gemella sp. GL1]
MVGNIKIKDLDLEDRPREKLLKYGPNVLSDKELLAILLRTGSKSLNVLELASSILKELGGVKNLRYATYNELKKFKGVGQVKALDIIAAIEFSARIYSDEITEVIKCDNPKTIAQYYRYKLENLKQEILMVIDLDTKGKIVAEREVFKGGLSSSLIHPREIFKDSLRNSAATIVCLHNHPSGDPSPSLEDIFTTKKLQEVGDLLGIPLLDHIIIAKEGYVSIGKLIRILEKADIEIASLKKRELDYIIKDKDIVSRY